VAVEILSDGVYTTAPSASSRTDAASPLEVVISVLFFFSGMPALLYQLMWERALFRYFGVNVQSVTVVVTAFMLGLGIGSLAGGWLSMRPRLNLLIVLAALEIGIAAFGLGSLSLFDRVGGAVAGWPLVGIAGASLAMLLPPTLLMGASLPVLVGQIARRAGDVGAPLGRLYFSNTLGAAAACLLGIVLIFPFFGMHDSVAIAALMNAAVAAGALVARFRGMAGVHPMAEQRTVPTRGVSASIRFPLALALGFGSGALALAHEVFFFRVASFMTASNAAAFPTILAPFLFGIAVGARETSRWQAKGRTPDETVMRLARGLAVGVMAGLLFLPVLRWVCVLNAGVAVGVGLMLIYVTARNWGLLLPYLATRSIVADDQAGRRLSYLYLANILGAASGSILTGFVLADVTGLRGMAMTLGIAAVLLAVASVRILAVSAGFDVARRWTVALILILLAAELPLTSGAIDAIQLQRHTPITEAVENRSGIITVDRDEFVFGNGAYDGQFNVDLMNDENGIERAYAIALYRPEPRHVLVIGMSSGSWSQVIANLGSVDSVTIVEINPGYAGLIAERPAIASLLTNPKVRLIVDDGRRWLVQHPEETFDAVVANTSYHFRANATNVLSVEFMELVRRHLRPDGVLFYNTTESLRSMRTGCAVFADGLRIEHFMAVGDFTFRPDAERWRKALAEWKIDRKPVLDLGRAADRQRLDELVGRVGDLDNPDLPPAGKYVERCASVLDRTAGRALITDDNMGTEWRTNLGFKP